MFGPGSGQPAIVVETEANAWADVPFGQPGSKFRQVVPDKSTGFFMSCKKIAVSDDVDGSEIGAMNIVTKEICCLGWRAGKGKEVRESDLELVVELVVDFGEETDDCKSKCHFPQSRE